MQPADPHFVTVAAAIAERWAWPGLDRVEIDGQAVDTETVIVEVLNAAHGIGLLSDSTQPPPQLSAVNVEAAARLLATYHVMYEDRPYGWGWEAVLTHLDHAYAHAMNGAHSQPMRDRIDAAYSLLAQEVRRGSRDDAS